MTAENGHHHPLRGWMKWQNGVIALCWYPKQTVRLGCAWTQHDLIRLVHWGPTLNDILLKLSNVQHMPIIDASLGYNNLQLDMQSSYLTMFACLFGRYHYKHLPFGAALVGNMFQRKINEIFNDISNVFGIADDILLIGYDKDEADHNKAVYNVLSQCQNVNLKLNKDKCHFRCTSIQFFVK